MMFGSRVVTMELYLKNKIEGARCCHLSNAWDGTRLSLELYLKTRLKGRDVATIIFSSSALQRNHNQA